jgi:flagellar biosynthesis/type III secretory pathway M-ring protein FliF/YscJ
MENLWGFVIVGGPIILGVVLLWAITHNRMSRAEWRRSEEATKRMHEEQNREDMNRDNAG